MANGACTELPHHSTVLLVTLALKLLLEMSLPSLWLVLLDNSALPVAVVLALTITTALLDRLMLRNVLPEQSELALPPLTLGIVQMLQLERSTQDGEKMTLSHPRRDTCTLEEFHTLRNSPVLPVLLVPLPLSRDSGTVLLVPQVMPALRELLHSLLLE